MKYLRNIASVLFLTLIVGCAQLGIAAPETFNEKWGVTLSLVTQVRQTATTLVETKKITADDGQNVLTATDTARAGLDITRKMAATDPAGADNKLTAIRTGLTALAAYLATKK